MAHHHTLSQRLDALHYRLRETGNFEAAVEMHELAALARELEDEDLETANKIGALEDELEEVSERKNELEEKLGQAKRDLERAESLCESLSLQLAELRAEQ